MSVSPRRRSVRLTVERDASVTAVAPPQVTRAEPARMVEAKRSWLYGKLVERREPGESRPPREYVSGERFLYLGRSYRLRIVGSAAEDRRERLRRLGPDLWLPVEGR
ncbi:hypothetical protein GCM10010517_34420 [Streptosporangium fragile]|uniref:YgjP-like metallopeptidase domain-containing protein n=1 Tax=Streptosporangium fragile TaxID=46186 RepID=A0ABP6IDZ7_9ACTN